MYKQKDNRKERYQVLALLNIARAWALHYFTGLVPGFWGKNPLLAFTHHRPPPTPLSHQIPPNLPLTRDYKPRHILII